MATDAPITGAPTRAPETLARSVSMRATDVHAFARLIADVAERAIAVCETIEVDALRFDREFR